jgi:pre-mRNA-splicing helicase BRR2
LIKYDRNLGIFSSTALGKIASHYYIKFASIAIYNEHLKPFFGIVDILKVFSLSIEFKYLSVRE